MSLAELLQDPDALARRFASVTLEGVTLYLPDTFLPEARGPVDFFFAMHADHATWMSPTTRAFVPVELEARAALVDLVRDVCARGDVAAAPDTAVGRDVTTVTARIRVPVATEGRSASLAVNHMEAERRPCEPWPTLLAHVAELFGDAIQPDEVRRLAWLGAPRARGPYR